MSWRGKPNSKCNKFKEKSDVPDFIKLLMYVKKNCPCHSAGYKLIVSEFTDLAPATDVVLNDMLEI